MRRGPRGTGDRTGPDMCQMFIMIFLPDYFTGHFTRSDGIILNSFRGWSGRTVGRAFLARSPTRFEPWHPICYLKSAKSDS